MTANPWGKFFWNDWETDPALKLCSLAAQGLWMRCLCICAKADPKGYLVVAGRSLGATDLARLTGVSETEVENLLDELALHGVFSRDRSGRIYSRRMVRDDKKARTARKNGKTGGNPQLCNHYGISPSDNPPVNGVVKPQSPEARSQSPEESSLRSDSYSNRHSDDDFETWYWAYPKHVGKGQARKAYRTARKKASAQELLDGAKNATERYRDSRPEFIPYPATWLNGERWLDESPPSQSRDQSLHDFLFARP